MDKLKLAKLVLRLGLVLVFAYAGLGSLVNPNDWIGYLPPLAVAVVPAAVLLKVFSAYELLLVIWLASGKFVRYAAILSGLTMIGIIVSDAELFAITFRDLAIATGAAALAILSD